MQKVLDARQILFRLRKRRFQDVKELVLTGGELEEITDLAYFNFLEYLDLSHNQLAQAHQAACLQFAVLIDLSYNNLHSFIAIPGLPRLEILRLGHNRLICVNVSSCQRLRVLGVENNQLTDLKGVCECCALEQLNCANNQIAELAHFEALQRCQQLRSLYATGNPASCGTAYRWRLESALEQLEALDDQPVQHRRFDAARAAFGAADSLHLGTGRQGIEQAVAMQLEEKDSTGLSRKIERLEDQIFQLTGLMVQQMQTRPCGPQDQATQLDSAQYRPGRFSQQAGCYTAPPQSSYCATQQQASHCPTQQQAETISASQNVLQDDVRFFEVLCGSITAVLGFETAAELRTQLQDKMSERFNGNRRCEQMAGCFFEALDRDTQAGRQRPQNKKPEEKQSKAQRNSDQQDTSGVRQAGASAAAGVTAKPLFLEQSNSPKGQETDSASLFKTGSLSSQEPAADEVLEHAPQRLDESQERAASQIQTQGAGSSNPSSETRNDNSSVVRLQKQPMRDRKDSSQRSSSEKQAMQHSDDCIQAGQARNNQHSSRFFEHEDTATISSYSAALSGHEDCHLPRAATMIKPPSAEPQISDIELGSRPISQLSNKVDDAAAENARTVDVAAKFKAEQTEEKLQQNEKSESIPSRISITESQSERLDQAARVVKPIADDDDDLDDFDGVDLEPDW